MQLQVVYKSLSELVPYAMNARTHSSEQIDQIVASIREFGFNNPVLIDSDGGIIAGHGRVLAAQRLGLAKVPTITIGHLSERQRRAYILADNRIAMNAGWDFEKLAEELSALADADFDLGLTGFDEQELDALLKGDNNLLPDGPLPIGHRPAQAEAPIQPTIINEISLPAGDKAPLRQMTFTLSENQAKRIEQAVARVKDLVTFDETENINSNGNAIAYIVEFYLGYNEDGVQL